MRKRHRVQQVAGVLGELLAGEARARWRRGRNGSLDPEELEHGRAQALSSALERLGPLYVKVGQVLSTRPDIGSMSESMIPGTLVGPTPNSPRYSTGAFGFGSHISIWLGPPRIHRMITEFLRG